MSLSPPAIGGFLPAPPHAVRRTRGVGQTPIVGLTESMLSLPSHGEAHTDMVARAEGASLTALFPENL
jgi:hypothetical protein